MPTNTIEPPQEIYQIKVTLLGTNPPIWRRLLVPADLTLEQLHHVLQRAMGWEDCHMHEFRIGQQRFGKPDPSEKLFGGSRTASERSAVLFSVLGRVGTKAVYTYDFGDSWEHGIVVEKRLPPEPGRGYPACLAGEDTARRKTAAACRGFTTFWRRSATRRTSNMKNSGTGWVVSLTRRPFPSMRSIDGWRVYGVAGARLPLA
jgi:hypothetical protein